VQRAALIGADGPIIRAGRCRHLDPDGISDLRRSAATTPDTALRIPLIYI